MTSQLSFFPGADLLPHYPSFQARPRRWSSSARIVSVEKVCRAVREGESQRAAQICFLLMNFAMFLQYTLGKGIAKENDNSTAAPHSVPGQSSITRHPGTSRSEDPLEAGPEYQGALAQLLQRNEKRMQD